MKTRLNQALIYILLFALCLSLAACEFFRAHEGSAENGSSEINSSKLEAAMTPALPPSSEASVSLAETTAHPEAGARAVIAAVGDVLIHQSLINGAKTEDGGYDFSPLFRYTKDIIAKADLAFFDMEGTFRGEPYSGFPSFSAPEPLAANLKAAGWDVAVTANNHAMDFDIPALIRTVQTVRAAGLEAIGTRADAGDPKFLLKELNGMKIGFTAYTYESERGGPDGTLRTLNNVPFSKENEALIDSFSVSPIQPELKDQDAEIIKKRIKEMREAGAEAIVFFMHWGTEYAADADSAQLYYAQLLADEGVTLCIACGPHVVQPIRDITSRDGSHDMLCYYSVGNFVSNQQYDTGQSEGRAQDGLIALASFVRGEDGKVRLGECGYVGTFVYKQYPEGKEAELTKAVVLPVQSALKDPKAFELDKAAVEELKGAAERLDKVMSKNSPETFTLKEFSDFFKP